jgi:hypothetical protein
MAVESLTRRPMREVIIAFNAAAKPLGVTLRPGCVAGEPEEVYEILSVYQHQPSHAFPFEVVMTFYQDGALDLFLGASEDDALGEVALKVAHGGACVAVRERDADMAALAREMLVPLARQRMLLAVQGALTPDLLKPPYCHQPDNPTAGHCYAAAEALYHLLGGKAAGLTPQVGRDETGGTHWWLRTDEGRIIDPTAEQYTSRGLTPPYAHGKGAGFLTRKPSRRAQALIARVRPEKE